MIHHDNPFLRPDRALDFDAIGGALQNGDLSGAQKAIAALESTFQEHKPAGTAANSTTAAASSGNVNVVA